MRHFLIAALVCATLLAPVLGQAGPAPVRKYTASLRDSQVHDRQLLVEMDLSRGSRSASAALNHAGVKRVSTLATSRKTYEIVRVPDGQDYMAALHELESDPRVLSVGPNVIKHVSGTLKQASEFVPNDPRFLNDAADTGEALTRPFVYDSQWGLLIAGAQDAWETTTGDPGVVVADLDTGVNFNQEDMQNRWWINTGEIAGNGQDDDGNGFVDDARGYDFYTVDSDGGDSDPTDPSGDELSHGNATASIIGARMHNGIGMAGVAGGDTQSNGIRLMPVRVGTDSDIPVSAEIAGIDYAIQMGADVISMSFGGVSGGAPEEDAIDRAWNAGLVICAAGGNEGAGNGDNLDLPAAFENCICVGATTIFSSQGISNSTSIIPEQVAGYSKTGPEMDVAAPGTHIIAAMNSGGAYTSYNPPSQEFTGTSAATPIVAGLAALIKSADQGLTNTQIRQRIELNTVDLGPTGFDEEVGHGRINMATAIPPVVHLVNGDTNGDGTVNNADLDQIRQRFGAQTGDASYVARVDCNSDGVIDELDVFVVGRHFGESN